MVKLSAVTKSVKSKEDFAFPVTKVTTISFEMHQQDINAKYKFKINSTVYKGDSCNYISPFVFLKDFVSKGLNFDLIQFPPEDSQHQFVIVKKGSNTFLLIMGFGNGEFIEIYELDKKTLLAFIKKIALEYQKDVNEQWDNKPDGEYNKYIEEFVERSEGRYKPEDIYLYKENSRRFIDFVTDLIKETARG